MLSRINLFKVKRGVGKKSIVVVIGMLMLFSTIIIGTTITGHEVIPESRTTGSDWVKQGVVLDGTGFNLGVQYPYVLYHEGIYKMWYSGHYASLNAEIYYATSPDGVNWTQYGCVLPKPPGTEYVVVPSVIIEGDGTYKMWFSCHDGPYRSRTYLATSDNGIDWTNQGLVLDIGPPGSPDSVYTVHAKVFKDGGLYKMYYKAYDDNTVSSIMYATSSDGYAWTKHGVVIDQPSGFSNIGCPYVVKNAPDDYTIWYYGTQGVTRIYIAHSTDGLIWTQGEVDLDVGAPGELDDAAVHGPYVMIDPVTGEELMYYAGSDGSKARIFLAKKEGAGNGATVDLSIYNEDITISDPNPTEGVPVSIEAVVHGDPGTTNTSTDEVLIFEDDFDAGNLNKWQLTQWNPCGILEVTTVVSHSSPYSLHCQSDPGTNTGPYVCKGFGQTYESVKAETWVYLPAKAQEYDQWTLLRLSAFYGYGNNNNYHLGITLDDDDYKVDVREDIWLSNGQTQQHMRGMDLFELTPCTWYQLVLEIDGDVFTAEINGNTILTGTRYDTDLINYMFLGDTKGSSGGWGDVYWDDVSVWAITETQTVEPGLDATCTVSFYLDYIAEGNLIDRQHNVFVPGDGETTVTTSWIADIPGNHDIIVEVSDVNPPDSDLTNNVASKPIFVESSVKVDLYITNQDIILSENPPTQGVPVTIEATVHGDAGLDATCTVSFYLDAINSQYLIHQEFNVFVPGGGETTVNAIWTPTVPGSHTIIVVVSDVNPPDSDNSNNYACFQVFVEEGGNGATATATGPQGAHHDPIITITYDWTEAPAAVDLYYSTNAGESWNYLGTDTSVDGYYDWTPEANPGPKPSKFYWIANAQNGADDVGIPADGTPPEAGPFNWKTWDVCEDAPKTCKPGADNWYFISFPLDISGDVLTVFDDARWGDGGTTWDYIQWYDASDTEDHWKSYSIHKPPSLNDMPFVDNTMGLWIHLTSSGGDGMLTIGEGVGPVSTTINLYSGWNLVGYPSFTEVEASDALWGTGADNIMVFDPQAPYRISEVPPTHIMKPGEGYWVHVPFDTVWIVDW